MGSMSVWHWLILLAVVLLLFGGSGKISSIMTDVAKGIKSFKKGMADDETPAAANPGTRPADQIGTASRPAEAPRPETPNRT